MTIQILIQGPEDEVTLQGELQCVEVHQEEEEGHITTMTMSRKTDNINIVNKKEDSTTISMTREEADTMTLTMNIEEAEVKWEVRWEARWENKEAEEDTTRSSSRNSILKGDSEGLK